MKVLTKLRKKLYRRRLPAAFQHMKTLHPDFRLVQDNNNGYQIRWRGRPIGTTQSLSALPPAAVVSPSRAAFIIASGPSVAELDLTRLRGRCCVGVNGSIALAETAGAPFTYHVIADRTFVKQRFDLVRQVLQTVPYCLLTFRVLSEICERDTTLLAGDNVYLFNEINAVYGQPKAAPEALDTWLEDRAGERDGDGLPPLLLHPTVRRSGGRVGFSRRLDWGVFTAQTVVFSALQIVYALGFRRVYIVGMDLGGGGDYVRFYETAASAARTRLDRDFEPYILPAFEVARRLCDTAGAKPFSVYNLSAQSRLPAAVIPKLSFEQALAQEASPTTAINEPIND